MLKLLEVMGWSNSFVWRRYFKTLLLSKIQSFEIECSIW